MSQRSFYAHYIARVAKCQAQAGSRQQETVRERTFRQVCKFLLGAANAAPAGKLRYKGLA